MAWAQVVPNEDWVVTRYLLLIPTKAVAELSAANPSTKIAGSYSMFGNLRTFNLNAADIGLPELPAALREGGATRTKPAPLEPPPSEEVETGGRAGKRSRRGRGAGGKN